MNRAKPNSHAGFTLVELVVASGITVAIAAMILGLVANVLAHWNRVQGRLLTEGQAQRVLDQLTQDLQGAIYRADGKAWLAASVQPGQGASSLWRDGAKPAAESLDLVAESLGACRFGQAGVWLRFFAVRPGVDQRTGDTAMPVAVSYQLIRRSPSGENGPARYLFYRAEATAAATFAAGYDLRTPAYIAPSAVDGATGNLVSPRPRQIIAENVIDFGVRLYGHPAATPVNDSRGLARLFPNDAATLEYWAISPPWATARTDRMPWVVDVMLRVLTEEGAQKISALENGQASGNWWQLALAHSVVFTRRILIRSEGFGS